VRNLAHGFELVQSIERQHAVEILLCEGCIDMQVVYAYVAICRCSRKNSIRWIGGPGIPALDLLIKWPIGLQGNSCGTHNRDRALCQRLGQRTPRDLP